MSEEAIQFLTHIVKGLVEHPDNVVVERIVDERGVLLTVTTNADDVRHLIGKEGAMAAAIRKIMHCYGGRRLCLISMKINEPASKGVVMNQ